MANPNFQFSNVVVVDGNNIGVIVKTWQTNGLYEYDVYVRSYNRVMTYPEHGIEPFVYDKELADD